VGYRCFVNRCLLAGPESHPFHPLLVPLPIGALVTSLIFDFLTRAAAASCGRPDVRDNVDVDIPDRLAWHGGQEAMTDGHG
jgi:hypothetical protein